MIAWRQSSDLQKPSAVPNAKGVGGTEKGNNHFRNSRHLGTSAEGVERTQTCERTTVSINAMASSSDILSLRDGV